MATLTKTPMDGFAHCVDARCPGYQQERVPVVRHLTEHRYVDNGGDLTGVEKSFITFAFADDEDRHCKHCGRHRDATDEERPVYDPLSGKDPMGLLHIKPGTALKDPAVVALEGERDELLKRLEALEAKVA